MSPILFAALGALVVMIVSLSGVLFMWKRAGSWLEENLHYLISFSAGVFLLLAINVTIESVEFTGGVWISLAALMAGIFLTWGIQLLFPEAHHHHEKHHTHRHGLAGARRIMFGDAAHNIADGILIVPAFVVDVRLGAAVLIGVLVHEFAQEISEFIVYKEAGYSTGRALFLNFLVSATILIGVALGALLTSYDSLVGLLLALSAGSFFFVVAYDLVPNSLRKAEGNKRNIATALLLMLVGVASMYMLGRIVPEGHGEEAAIDSQSQT